VLDCYHESYAGAPADGRPWDFACAGDTRVVKGGGFASNPEALRASDRAEAGPDTRRDDLGFRCCAPPP
jgi:formylglycine-generating enzyme required for sulfatase activity